jgi:hypothetical protein
MVTVTNGGVAAADFGLRPVRFASVSGLLWLETGDFGVHNAEESGLSGVSIQLLDTAGNLMQTYNVEADGIYHFGNLLPGDYIIRIDTTTLPDRMYVTHNPDGSSDFDTAVTLSAGVDVEAVEFGIVGTF